MERKPEFPAGRLPASILIQIVLDVRKNKPAAEKKGA